MVDAPERIWAWKYTGGFNRGEWTGHKAYPDSVEYIRADLVTARCSSCDGSGDVHRADGEWLGECNCGSEFRHAFDVEANPSKAYRVIRSQAARIAALEAQLAERAGGVKVKPLDPDMPAQQLRMHLGEMTAQELRTARAAIRLANSALESTPPAPKVTEGEWRYEIKYGPEGEANYAFVYDEGGHLVSNLKVHHAIAVVTAMNATLTAAQEAGKP